MIPARIVNGMPMWLLRVLTLVIQLQIAFAKCWRNRRPGTRAVLYALTSNVCQLFIMLVGSFGLRFGIYSSCWGWLRKIDDRVDRETTLPKGITIEEYLQQKGELLKAFRTNRLRGVGVRIEDILFVHAIRGAAKLGVDLFPEFKRQLYWFGFDDERRKSGKPIGRDVRREYASSLEESVLWIATAVLGGNLTVVEEMCRDKLGLLQITEMTYDLVDDIRAGYSPIPFEDVETYEISIGRLACVTTWKELLTVPGVASWLREEVIRLNTDWQVVETKLKPNLRKAIPPLWARIAFWVWLRKERGELDTLLRRCAVN